MRKTEMTKSVYVTGAAGLIGKDVVRAFCEAEWKVTAADVVTPPLDAELEKAVWCIERVEDLSAATLTGYDAVVHLGALTLSSEQKTFGATTALPDARPMLGVNVLGTENIFRASSEARTPCVVYASTAAVYGRPLFHTHLSGGTVLDTGPFRPSSLYAHTKLMCEGLADFYSTHGSTRFIGLRPTFSYGLGRLTGISGMFALWLAKAIRGERAILPFPFGLEGQLQLIYVKDMAQSFVDAAIAGSEGANILPKAAVYNSPTKQILKMEEIQSIVRATTDNDDVHVTEGPFTPELQMPTMSTSEAFKMLGCVQRFPLAEAIKDMANELRRSPGIAL
jgi:UDP-glucose 4-epimerase